MANCNDSEMGPEPADSLKPGDGMTFTLLPDGTFLPRIKNKSVLRLAGWLHKRGRKTLLVEDLSR
jgi:hypothetical protein